MVWGVLDFWCGEGLIRSFVADLLRTPANTDLFVCVDLSRGRGSQTCLELK